MPWPCSVTVHRRSGAGALHNIWGMTNVTEMATLSLAVLAAYTVLALAGAIRLFTKAGTS